MGLRALRLVVSVLGLTASLGVSGCADHMLALSKSETDEIISGLSVVVETERARARQIGPAPARQPVAAQDVPEALTLSDALSIAHRWNRDLISDREGLILSAISLRNAQRDVEPTLAGSVTSVLRGTESGEDIRDSSAALSLTGLLPTGGRVTLSGDADRLYGRGDVQDVRASGSLTASITQPLLRGAGRESAYEALTDAERQALYDIRTFETSRQDLALRVQRQFYEIVAQNQVARNRRQSLEQFRFLMLRSESLFAVDRVSEVDKFRATREFLSAENDLVDAEQELEARLDRFKILLGLDTGVDLAVAEEVPDAKPVEVAMDAAIRIALRNRLDLMTARDQVDDGERRVRIRGRDLLPQVDVVAGRTRAADPGRHVRSLGFDDDSFSIALQAELPLDRVRERGALRSARIALQRARRNLARLEDTVILEVRRSLRAYRSSVSSFAIQKRIVVSEEKNAKVASLRFEEGQISNRDLTDAQNNLTDARDRLINEQVNVETSRVQLLRDLGGLVIDENGRWIE